MHVIQLSYNAGWLKMYGKNHKEARMSLTFVTPLYLTPDEDKRI